jgi:uncharacterized protein (DUF697 family)
MEDITLNSEVVDYLFEKALEYEIMKAYGFGVITGIAAVGTGIITYSGLKLAEKYYNDHKMQWRRRRHGFAR